MQRATALDAMLRNLGDTINHISINSSSVFATFLALK